MVVILHYTVCCDYFCAMVLDCISVFPTPLGGECGDVVVASVVAVYGLDRFMCWKVSDK